MHTVIRGLNVPFVEMFLISCTIVMFGSARQNTEICATGVLTVIKKDHSVLSVEISSQSYL